MLELMDIQIRSATEYDYSAIDELMCHLHNAHVSNRPDMYQPIEHPCIYEEYVKRLQDVNSLVLVATTELEIIGICFITFRNSTNNPEMVSCFIAYIEAICIREEYQNSGVGRKLYQHTTKLSKEKGVKRLELMVWNFNTNAMEFYKHMGMKIQRSFFEVNLSD